MDKLTETLKGLIPAEQLSEVTSFITEALEEAKAQLEAEFNEKLGEAYAQLEAEKANDEAIAEAGYKQAYDIIQDYQKRLEEQKVEFETYMRQGFEEAYQEIQEEKAKNESIELKVYQEADAKLAEMKAYLVDVVDKFLDEKEKSIYEAAKRDILNDPRVLEHRVAMEKVADVLADYLGQDVINVSSSKIEEANKSLESLRGQLRIVESQNLRLQSTNDKLKTQLTEANSVIEESHRISQTNRANKSGTASGRGHRVADEQTKVIAEFNNTEAAKSQTVDTSTPDFLSESVLLLSGVIQNDN